MVKPKLPTAWALVGAAGALAGFVLVLLGGFLAMLGAGAGAPLARHDHLRPRPARQPIRIGCFTSVVRHLQKVYL
jgi:hypothetical protein